MQEGAGKDRRLYDAVCSENFAVIRELLKNGIVLEQWAYQGTFDRLFEWSMSPLDKAIHLDNLEMVKLLLLAPNDPKNWKQRYLICSLEFAAYIGSEKYVLLILKNFEIPLSPSAINRALGFAAINGYLGVVKILVETGKADLNHNGFTETESTPLVEAVLGGHLEIVQFLVEQGSDVDFRDDSQDVDTSAVQYAVSHGHWEIVEFLIPSLKDSSDKRYAKKHLERYKRLSAEN
jgi:ankyrin repeat protein